MAYVKTALFRILLVFWTALFVLPIAYHIVARSPYVHIRVSARVWIWGIVYLLQLVCGLRHDVFYSREAVVRPVLYVSNHQSIWETIVFFALFPDVAIVAKKELFSIPIFGWYLKKLGMIPVNREGTGTNKAMLRMVKQTLHEGRDILIFPEGTRVPYKEERVYQNDGIRVILHFARNVCGREIPIVPIIHNAGRFWPRHGNIISPGCIKVYECYVTPLEKTERMVNHLKDLL
tara:strand:+ start:12759 stop:13457 length:699 start_codon:yes stop_codon:yes gene_type:complete